ncbi:MAG: UPF0149 family protein [Betaproteobacteria bacterium]
MSDLSDVEIDELDELLARTPAPYRPLDAVMLDGYLCGVLVQPRRIEADEWLPPIFDVDGAAFPASADPDWRARCTALIVRRHEALRRSLVEDGGFEPVVAQVDDATDALAPWRAGFDHALAVFPDLAALRDDAVSAALARLHRPCAPLDAAIDELVGAVADLEAATHDRRWRVETMKREAPKVGRNEPCPCGSGRKFKHCHGAA